MNYEKYLIAAGVPVELRAEALEYLAKCERDYKTARIEDQIDAAGDAQAALQAIDVTQGWPE